MEIETLFLTSCCRNLTVKGKPWEIGVGLTEHVMSAVYRRDERRRIMS
jgi:hypothetical protein